VIPDCVGPGGDVDVVEFDDATVLLTNHVLFTETTWLVVIRTGVTVVRVQVKVTVPLSLAFHVIGTYELVVVTVAGYV